MPFRETDRTDHPLTLYAATKKASEDMAHSYAHLWKTPTTAFRFFTVYGPWGRPDMALFKFVAATLRGEPVEVYGHGEMRRDFTYVDDLVEAVVRLIDTGAARGRAGRREGFAIARRALSRGQYRRRPAGRADGVHRGDRAGARAADRKDDAADAEGRRARDLGRAGPAAGADGLRADDRRGDGRAGVRGVVSRRIYG